MPNDLQGQPQGHGGELWPKKLPAARVLILFFSSLWECEGFLKVLHIIAHVHLNHFKSVRLTLLLVSPTLYKLNTFKSDGQTLSQVLI